jgi:hypothetical protein
MSKYFWKLLYLEAAGGISHQKSNGVYANKTFKKWEGKDFYMFSNKLKAWGREAVYL